VTSSRERCSFVADSRRGAYVEWQWSAATRRSTSLWSGRRPPAGRASSSVTAAVQSSSLSSRALLFWVAVRLTSTGRAFGPSCRRYWVTRPQITSKSSSRAVRQADRLLLEPTGRRRGRREPHRHGTARARRTDGRPAVSSWYLRRVSAGTEVAAASATV